MPVLTPTGPVAQSDPLRHALRVFSHTGFRIGVHHAAPSFTPPPHNLFFHAERLRITLPTLRDLSGRTWYTHVHLDPASCAPPEPHPADDPDLQHRARAAARAALYQTLASYEDTRLSYPDFLSAKRAGHTLPTPRLLLVPWTPDPDLDASPPPETPPPGALIVAAALTAGDRHTLHHAMRHAARDHLLFLPAPALTGYPDYDALPRIVHLTLSHGSLRDSPPSLDPPLSIARTRSLQLVLDIEHPDTQTTEYLPTDIALRGEIDQPLPHPFLLIDHQHPPPVDTLAALLDRARLLIATDTSEQDALAHATAHHLRAHTLAAALLLDPDTALHHTVIRAAFHHLCPLLRHRPPPTRLLLEIGPAAARILDSTSPTALLPASRARNP